jgi:NAD-dependent SIR2 family protein deacetylase
MQDPLSADLDNFVRQHPRLFVLCGAGVSTDSGIPGYRDDEGQWKRKPPVMLQDFLSSEAVRRRYWARSIAGWPMLANARPNGAHRALARLESQGRLQKLVTQNVDGLHQQAGSSDVIELHGNAGKVICLDCGAGALRENIQRVLEEANPEFTAICATAAPDGDADFEPRRLEAFKLPVCARCGGVLKPDVVFFGDSVPRDRVDAALNALEQAAAVLVVGSSLMVYSGYRFCERAWQMAKPIAAINMGRTRADHLFTLKLSRSCAEALAGVVERLEANQQSAAHAVLH